MSPGGSRGSLRQDLTPSLRRTLSDWSHTHLGTPWKELPSGMSAYCTSLMTPKLNVGVGARPLGAAAVCGAAPWATGVVGPRATLGGWLAGPGVAAAAVILSGLCVTGL